MEDNHRNRAADGSTADHRTPSTPTAVTAPAASIKVLATSPGQARRVPSNTRDEVLPFTTAPLLGISMASICCTYADQAYSDLILVVAHGRRHLEYSQAAERHVCRNCSAQRLPDCLFCTTAAIGWGLTATGWVVSPYIGRLLDRAYAYFKPSKAREKIRFLVTQTLPQLKLILEAAEGSEHKHLFEDLLTELKSAFYDTEDILAEIEYIRRHGNPSKGGIKRKLDSSLGTGPSNKGIGDLSSLTIPRLISGDLTKTLANIEKLIEGAHEIIKLKKLQSNKKSDEHMQNDPASNINGPITSDSTGKVTGREKTLEEIKHRLREEGDNKRLSVIGIIGIPGSGKTTLAQCVYQSERNDSHFDLVMWIHVSKYFTVKNIYSEMFEQAWKKFGNPDKDCPKYDCLNVLKDELKNVLNGKLFLLVLDDIWFSTEETTIEKKLQELLIPLENGKRESKILVTSREDSLLRLGPKVTSTVYQIPDLDDEVFLELFMEYALDDNRASNEDKGKLQEIGSQIAQKLKKLPLLARVVGGILFQKPTVEVRDWLSVRDENLLDKYMGALWWSYQHLGEQARRCFAYCSVFPRRYRLRRDELVNLWVAEGFINTTNVGHEMEAVGRDYFNKLLSSSFLLPGEDFDGKEYFVIHDLLYDLAMKVAGDDCFRIENCWTTKVPPNVRHLSIQSCSASMITDHVVKLKKLRTLIIFNGENGISLDNMFRKLSKHLRVLIFRTDKYSIRDHTGREISFPKSIACLKLLRYLGISTWSTMTLPGTLDKLYLLQVLDFGLSADIYFSFGEDIIKLVDLRHVYNRLELCFPNVGSLISLQTMPSYNLGGGATGYELHQLENLNKLQCKLELYGLELVVSKEEAVKAKLAEKEQLTELVLYWDISGTDYNLDLQADVLEVLCPPYIKHLSISDYQGSRYPSWMVGTQRRKMHLHELALNLCRQPVCDPEHFFISASSLVLRFCNWHTLPYNMQHLTSLQLENCYPLPSNLEHLTSLRKLIICDDRMFYEDDSRTLPTLPGSLEYIEIETCNIRGRQNWDKIKNIPEKNIDGSAFDDIDDGEFEDPPARALQRQKWVESRS